jgi:hypothetical protein
MEPNPVKRDKIIGLFRAVDLVNREAWPEYCEWLVDDVVGFRAAFMPRIKALKLNEVVAVHD